MDWKLELVAVPVSDVDRAKRFYTEQVGFNADHDHQVSDDLRFVQLTPPGSACSIVLGTGITDAPPGSVTGLQLVVSDIEMPGMNGFDLAEALRADPRGARLPIIALSSITSPAAIERGRQAGFHDFVAKFDRQGLIAALKESTVEIDEAA